MLGKDWVAPSLQDSSAGVYCRACKKRHGYNGYQKVNASFERQGKAWVILWSCPATGNVIEERYLGGTEGEATPPEADT